ncbi:MAG: MBL fold metallo-hydrolase [Clostridia bacterium]
MKMLFLGTGAGEGYPGRFCECPYCAYAREHGGRNLRVNSSAVINDEILLDMNAPTYDQAARFGLSLARVQAALITHPHSDHLYLPDLGWRAGRTDAVGLPVEEQIALGSAPRFTAQRFLDIYGNGYTEEAFKAFPFDYAKLEMAFHRIEPGVPFACGAYRILPIRGEHVKYGYSTVYVVEHEGKTLLYATDSGNFDAEARELLRARHYDLIVMEGTGGLGYFKEGHMYLQKNAEWRRFFLENGCITEKTPFVLTHLSPHWTPPYDQYCDIAGEKGMIVAYDGYSLTI